MYQYTISLTIIPQLLRCLVRLACSGEHVLNTLSADML